MAISRPHLLALTAAGAYTVSILVLGHLATAGEAPSTTNSLYNSAASFLVAAALVVVKPGAPASGLALLAIGAIAALRVLVLTIAAVSPRQAARVLVLSNLAFVWLAIGEALDSRPPSAARWGSLVLVVAGTLLANASSSQMVRITSQLLRRLVPR